MAAQYMVVYRYLDALRPARLNLSKRAATEEAKRLAETYPATAYSVMRQPVETA